MIVQKLYKHIEEQPPSQRPGGRRFQSTNSTTATRQMSAAAQQEAAAASAALSAASTDAEPHSQPTASSQQQLMGPPSTDASTSQDPAENIRRDTANSTFGSDPPDLARGDQSMPQVVQLDPANSKSEQMSPIRQGQQGTADDLSEPRGESPAHSLSSFMHPDPQPPPGGSAAAAAAAPSAAASCDPAARGSTSGNIDPPFHSSQGPHHSIP